jgi:hypothetical protein
VLEQRQAAGRLGRQARWIVGEEHAQLAIAPRYSADIRVGRDAEQPEEIEAVGHRLGDLWRSEIQAAKEAARKRAAGGADSFFVKRCGAGGARMHSYVLLTHQETERVSG